MSEINDSSNEPNSFGGNSVLQPSRLTGGSGNASHPVIRSGVLRPSVLGTSVLGSLVKNNSEVTALTVATDKNGGKQAVGAAESSNPFLKDQQGDDEDECDETRSSKNVTTSDASSSQNDKLVEDEEEVDERPDPLDLLRKNGLERANLFAAAKSSIPRVGNTGFVFGQNVHERVMGENIQPESTSNQKDSETTGDLLFSSVIQNAAKTSDKDSSAAKETETKTLNDVAREYEESRAQKRKYEEVETFTGEENEVNIVDINCKLFAFVNSNWEDRGRGSLRLNDSKNELECSRLVFRSSGNLRLLLNTKVWAGMVAERPSQKSLRITAIDNSGVIKIFLVMARPVEINVLHKALQERIHLRKTKHPEELATENNGNGAGGDTKDSVVAEDVEKAVEDVEPPNEDENTEPSPRKKFPLSEATN